MAFSVGKLHVTLVGFLHKYVDIHVMLNSSLLSISDIPRRFTIDYYNVWKS